MKRVKVKSNNIIANTSLFGRQDLIKFLKAKGYSSKDASGLALAMLQAADKWQDDQQF